MTPKATNEIAVETTSDSPRPAPRGSRWTSVAVSIFLLAIVWWVFGKTTHFDFVNFDDDDYVYENPVVARGLTQHGVVWAFTHFHSFNWHPLTWISHMADCEFYQLEPGGHHLTNVLLHGIAAILLFLVLRSATHFLWRSAFVAAVFAIHPLRVESVAWISERKDVLSGVFFMLTIGAYIYYARRNWCPRRYGWVLALFAMGLMCKPMLVTLPAVLILLDYWPLNRFQNSAAQPVFQLGALAVPRHLVFEKLPMFGMSVLSSMITFSAQAQARSSFAQLPFSSRVNNAVVSCAAYLEQLFWPSHLTVMYPLPTHRPGWQPLLAMVLMVGISLAAFVFRRKRPYLLTGWLWFLIMLAPVIGIFQVGAQARADRYTYLPLIGPCLLLTWLVADTLGRRRAGRYIMGIFSTAILAALMVCARAQTDYWQNSEILWTHSLACTTNNFTAEENLGTALLEKSYVDQAIEHFQKSLAINPRYEPARASLGSALYNKGEHDRAIIEFQKAVELDPKDPGFHNNLGNAFLRQGKLGEAIAQYEAATQIEPDFFAAQNNLGTVLLQQGNTNAAILHYEKALELARATGRWQVAQQLNAALEDLRKNKPVP